MTGFPRRTRASATICLLTTLACLAVAQAPAPVQRTLKRVNKGISLVPVRFARAMVKIGPDGAPRPVRIGEWIPYLPPGFGMATQSDVAYDEYEFAELQDLIPGDNGLYTGCGVADARFIFGGGYTKGFTYNDLHVIAAAKGRDSTRLGWAWSMTSSANNDFQYTVVTTENFPTTAGAGTGANDPGVSGRSDYPGVVYSYGPVGQNAPNTYYFSSIDISNTAFTHHLPNDGNGGVLTVFGDFNAGTNTLTPDGEPALWGLVPGNPTPACSTTQWDDDSPLNLGFTDGTAGTNNELYSAKYDHSAGCPLILGAMMCLFYTPAGFETLAPVSETINLGKGTIGNLASWAADDANARRICKFLVPNLFSPFIRVSLNFTATVSGPTAIDLIIKAKMVNAGVFKIRGFLQNKVTSAFVQVLPDTTINLSYATYTGSATGTMADYVGAAGAMTSRIEIQQTGISAVVFPCTDFEFANVKVTS